MIRPNRQVSMVIDVTAMLLEDTPSRGASGADSPQWTYPVPTPSPTNSSTSATSSPATMP